MRDGMTQAEVAKVLGVSLARVGQIERQALQKIRNRPRMMAQLQAMSLAADSTWSTHVVRKPKKKGAAG